MATAVLAVDLGAQSGRVAAVDLDARPLEPRVIYRFGHAPVTHDDGSLRWDWELLVHEVKRGLDLGLAEGPIASIGVDTWGVDYGLLDANGDLLSPPYCYRDSRTDGWRTVVERIGSEVLYEATGIQLMQINTIFQLAAHAPAELSRARRLLMLPELLVHALTGALMGERTSAGTSALIDLATGDWSRHLLGAIGVDPVIMPQLSRATSFAGTYGGTPVHLVGGHDTASAVAALPSPQANAVFISSGTWMLIGAEREAPDTSPAAMRANFSNEPGVFGNVRLLKNVMGLWMLEQCRPQWDNPPLEELLAAAAELPSGGPTVDATDARFLAPVDMEAEIRSGAFLPAGTGRDMVARCILDSLALAVANVVRELEFLIGATVPEVVVVGGGAQNTLLNRYVEAACGRTVRTGSSEATLLGNALVQGIALGMFESLDEARTTLAEP